MHRNRTVLISLFVFLCVLCAHGQNLSRSGAANTQAGLNSSDSLSSFVSVSDASLQISSTVGNEFFEIAYDLAYSQQVTGPRLELAIIFLTAAMQLDSSHAAIRELLIELACRDTSRDYSTMVESLLGEYLSETSDLEIARDAIRYLIEHQDSLEEKEELLERLLTTIAGKNAVIGSEISTLLGLLKAEKPDLDAAEFYLIQAYRNNRYNKLAYTNLNEIAPGQLSASIRLERLRLALRENPVDLEAAMAFAQSTEMLQIYDIAAVAYEYCADLYEYLYPSGTLPQSIYIPWAMSCYNSQRHVYECIRIAGSIRQQNRFDLRLEALAGKAALKNGDADIATQIIQDTEKKGLMFYERAVQRDSQTPGAKSRQIYAAQLAWFYSFVVLLPENALEWANIAYEADSSSAEAGSIFAYALVLNGQYDLAKQLVSSFGNTQISELALAEIQLAQNQKEQGIRTLQSAIARDPGSFAAERAKELLSQHDQKYLPPENPGSILDELEQNFNQMLGPVFVAPEEILSVNFEIGGNRFPYPNRFEGLITITNNSSEPVVISDDGLLKGNIRIDADISGDLDTEIANLVSTRSRTSLLIEPKRSILYPVKLYAGDLRKILKTHPQASLNIDFTLYLDPVRTSDGGIANRLSYIKPLQVRIQRPGFELTGSKYLIDRLNNLAGLGRLELKYETAELFTDLLEEQQAFAGGIPPYRFMYDEITEDILRTALTHEFGLLSNPDQSQWPVKVVTLAEMLSLSLNPELMKVVATNMYNENWPVRMMAVYLLAQNPQGNFNQVLDWVIQNDSNTFVRDMATVLRTNSIGSL